MSSFTKIGAFMLFLSKDLLVNIGTNRACYEHPKESSKCLKIDLKQNKETKRELKYYKRLQKENIPFTMLSKYYGSQETNYGKAEVFELIRDINGKISKEVDKYLNDTNNSFENIENLLKCIPQLKKYIFENKIYVKDLNTVNVMYQRNENSKESRLVIIDGLAHSNYNPIFYSCDYFILKKIEISWKSFIKSIKRKSIVKQNPQLFRYLQ